MNPEIRSRFVLGARSAMTIDHPAVVKVLRVEEPPDEPPYLLMEALSGESLSEYLDREGAMPQRLVLSLGLDVASGLAEAHDLGVVHRDVKPGNLYLVGPIGAPEGIKIIDFGLATDCREANTEPGKANLVLGTAQYMAPEQVLADPVDARTDIYAFGVVLFRLLTGHLPFDLDPCMDLFSHQLYSPAPPVSWLVDNVDPRLEQVILRCMRKHPDNRYSSMRGAIEDLRTILDRPAEDDGQISRLPLRRNPDTYPPKSEKGQQAARFLASQFGSRNLPLDAPPEITRDAAPPEITSDAPPGGGGGQGAAAEGVRTDAAAGPAIGPWVHDSGASSPSCLRDWLCADLHSTTQRVHSETHRSQ